MALIKRESLTSRKILSMKSWTRNQFLFCKKMLCKIRPGGALPYMGYVGMCRCEGYGFQAV